VRIVAATNRDMWQAVSDGEFRADLLYRINTFPIELPALRDRGDDIRLENIRCKRCCGETRNSSKYPAFKDE